MSKDVSVKTERVDDIPLLFAQLKRMGVQELLDKYFPAHGNRQGLSIGEVAVVWLSHILSQADHRMNHVQNWVENHIESIRKSLGKELVGLDLSDDRLGSVLKHFSDDSQWREFEEELTARQIQVYDLKILIFLLLIPFAGTLKTRNIKLGIIRILRYFLQNISIIQINRKYLLMCNA
jgi:transposase